MNSYIGLDKASKNLSLVCSHLDLPAKPMGRVGSFGYNINPFNSKGSLGRSVRQVGFYAALILSAEKFVKDMRTYSLGATLEAINRAPNVAFTRGAKHIVINYIVPGIKFAAGWMVVVGVISAAYVTLGHINPFSSYKNQKFVSAQEKILGQLQLFENLLRPALSPSIPMSRAPSAVSTPARGNHRLDQSYIDEPRDKIKTWSDSISAIRFTPSLQHSSFCPEKDSGLGDNETLSLYDTEMSPLATHVAPAAPTQKRLEKGVQVNLAIEAIFDQVKVLYEEAHTKCPYSNLEAFKGSSVEKVVQYLSESSTSVEV